MLSGHVRDRNARCKLLIVAGSLVSHCDPPGAKKEHLRRQDPAKPVRQEKELFAKLSAARQGGRTTLLGPREAAVYYSSGIVGRIMEFFPKDQWSR